MFTPDIVWLSLSIFLLRVLNNALGTVRVVFIARQWNLASAVLAFVESIIFAYTIANVVSDLSNPLIVTAYAGGFSVGGYLGMLLERRFIATFATINVIVPEKGHEIAVALRAVGFGVTETIGDGKDGIVAMLRSIVNRRDVQKVIDISRAIYPEAFITVEETRSIRQGYIRPVHGRKDYISG